jgi:GNAT superfamily N-acetyltransferase
MNSELAGHQHSLDPGPKVSVRAAVADDANSLQSLRELAKGHISQQRGGELALLREFAATETFGGFGAPELNAERLVCMGYIDDVAVGYASADILKLEGGYELCRLGELFVESDAREIGVGELLMKFVAQWAEERGCGGIDATAMPGDRDTKNFFETFGLVARAITVHKDLRGT